MTLQEHASNTLVRALAGALAECAGFDGKSFPSLAVALWVTEVEVLLDAGGEPTAEYVDTPDLGALVEELGARVTARIEGMPGPLGESWRIAHQLRVAVVRELVAHFVAPRGGR